MFTLECVRASMSVPVCERAYGRHESQSDLMVSELLAAVGSCPTGSKRPLSGRTGGSERINIDGVSGGDGEPTQRRPRKTKRETGISTLASELATARSYLSG